MKKVTKGTTKRVLPAGQRHELLEVLAMRFEEHPERHRGISFDDVRQRLGRAGGKLWSLAEMERTGGEPDVVGRDGKSGALLFVDCAAESPKGRRSLCFDRAARVGRKQHPPASSALEMAEEMGVELLTEAEYRALQELGAFDEKTSSWVVTPDEIRRRGGALFCDRRYGAVFVYHNGADSYYAARGFRAAVRV